MCLSVSMVTVCVVYYPTCTYHCLPQVTLTGMGFLDSRKGIPESDGSILKSNAGCGKSAKLVLYEQGHHWFIKRGIQKKNAEEEETTFHLSREDNISRLRPWTMKGNFTGGKGSWAGNQIRGKSIDKYLSGRKEYGFLFETKQIGTSKEK